MSTKQFTRGKGCHNRKLSDEDRLEIVRLYATPLPDGTWMGVTTIAKRFGVTHNCIQDRLRRAGVTLRSPKEAHAGGKRCKPIKNLPPDLFHICKCGCGERTEWNQRKNRWNSYVAGHYTQRLEQSPTWQGGRSFEPYAPGWPLISRAIRARDDFQCRCCGATERLHVHHVDTNKLNNDPANLVTLCVSCHAQTHAEMVKGGDAK